MAYRIPEFINGKKIESVGMYLDEIKNINENRAGDSTELFFRGQEAEFWSIEPSIFREDMLSIEHKLMLTPLQKLPIEFRNMQDTFEIMTKYQHYGMCTRLLDLTTNPLVALYFACKQHGLLEYEGDDTTEQLEPFGIVLFKTAYPVSSDDICIRIITALSKLDLDKENSIERVLAYLIGERIINDEKRMLWLSDEHIDDFINLLQCNYLVMPLYSNARLIKQSGAFLLPGLFGFVRAKDLRKSVITKCKRDLRNEFSPSYFYIDGSDKENILKELNWYNINEATLFPELEHQLNYIRQNNRSFTKPVDVFERYSYDGENHRQEIIGVLSLEAKECFEKDMQRFISGKIGSELEKQVSQPLHNSMLVDWYKRESVQSKMKVVIASIIGKAIDNPREIAADIVNYLVDRYINLSTDYQKT